MEMQKRRMCIVKGSTNSYEDNYKQNRGVYGDALYETV